MGELLGLPEWLFATLFVGGGLILVLAIAWRNTNKQISLLLQRRRNPSKAEFISEMATEVPAEVAEFLWDRSYEIVRPRLTPHPDDNLASDLPIDDEEWSLDWPREWAEQQGFRENNLPDWPEGWPPTVRNFGRWLSMPLD